MVHPVISDVVFMGVTDIINKYCHLINNYIDLLNENDGNYAKVDELLKDPAILQKIGITSDLLKSAQKKYLK
jgi:hypothetical protein